jgi:5S rRNA maturation endonuclease (ribonuclease M5)
MFKSLSEWKERLRQESVNKVVVVEGKRDRIRLEKMGVRNVLDISGKRIPDIADIIEGKFGLQEVILLTDLDDFGDRLRDKIGNSLEAQSYRVDYSFREFLRSQNIVHIEDL